MRRLLAVATLALMAPWLAAWPLTAQDAGTPPRVAVLDGAQARPDLAPVLEVAIDPQGAADLAAIRSRTFQPAGSAAPHFGFSDGAVWLRLALRNEAQSAWGGVLALRFPYIESADFYRVAADGSVRHQASGTLRPLAVDQVQSPFPALPLFLQPGAEETVYIRVASRGVLLTPLELEPRGVFQRGLLRDQLVAGLALGAAVAISLYVLALYYAARDPAQLAFVAFALASAAYALVSTGMAKLWLWPGPGWPATGLYVLVQGVLLATTFQFFRAFLRTRGRAPRVDMVLRGFTAAAYLGIGAPGLPGDTGTLLIGIVAGPGMIFLLGVALGAAWRGDWRSRIAVIGWGLAELSSIYLYLRVFDVTPYLPINHYLIMGSCSFATLFFAVALAAESRRQQTRLRMLERSSEAQAAQVAGLVHDLRTPLNGILGSLELVRVRSGGLPPSPLHEQIRSSAQHMLHLVTRILDASKLDAGRLDLAPAAADLADIAVQAAQMVRPLARKADVELLTLLGPQPVWRRVDGQALLQVLLNLLSNAIKFTEPGGRVTLDLATSEDGVLLRVADTGMGMAPTEIETALRPFGQVGDRAHRRLGTGLGLPMARSLVELHGGTLTLESVKGRGTTVTIRLPGRAIALTEPQAPVATAA